MWMVMAILHVITTVMMMMQSKHLRIMTVMVSQLVVIRLLQYDCNDNDPAASTDVDGDGFLACLDDCNDNDTFYARG